GDCGRGPKGWKGARVSVEADPGEVTGCYCGQFATNRFVLRLNHGTPWKEWKAWRKTLDNFGFSMSSVFSMGFHDSILKRSDL
ncbi:MAG: hypothetical protein KC940_09450, partial [Candidatus Omnitrophica bacterium]|nr:hypothetical protein [Candidatus Omnitrophota bacterium]